MAEETQDIEQLARGLRAEEQWLRYDTICIGPGAKAINSTWFENFSEFADADSLTWMDGSRTRQVGLAYCNQSGDTEDWSQRIYQTGIEFMAPPGIAEGETVALDSAVMPEIFTRLLPEMMSFRVIMQDLDDVLIAPGSHMPGIAGVSGGFADGAGSTLFDAGQRGTGDIRNSWTWPKPLGVPAKSKISVNARIDNPVKGFLRSLTTVPGSKSFVIPAALPITGFQTVTLRNWYRIMVWHRGPRFVQLRGARSAG